ncbi:hypothetical protein LO762_14460 [Actinocorallia sp. API 0066]|uniref:hypothetical protein n=1 Tax=Actinocorallia sp. API 0066 TaxID=2896846 RepID=UPI001E57E987|nr:hypothetical protein [Actinocorallia sp. API 0066]MCD0450386.1 hypothetical protein [Actinocorallia sp. API 0066]
MAYAEQEAVELAALQGRFPEWRLWRGQGGSWAATHEPLTARQSRAGMSRTLIENTRPELLAQLEAEALTDRHVAEGYLCTVEAARLHLRDRRPCCGATGPSVETVDAP